MALDHGYGKDKGDGGMKHDKPYDRTVMRSLAMISQFGLNMLVPIGMMTAAGIYLDRRFETGWITIVFFFVGAIAGGQNVYRMAKKIFSDDQDAKRYSRMEAGDASEKSK